MAEVAGFCPLCRSRCGTINVVEDGRLVEVRPNRAHPTGQAICPKGRSAPEIAHHARRLTSPLRRTRPKSEQDPGWVPISWDEALSEIAGRLGQFRSESGAESVAFAITSQSSSPISDSTAWIQRLVRTFGSPNNCFAVEICNWHKDYAHAFTFGCGLPTPDYQNADLIVLWGHDPANSWLAQAQAIGAARARGARLVVIDPHKSGSALDADIWCRVRPGSDGALALGIARHLIERGAFDSGFVKRWSNAPFLVCDDTGLFLRGVDLGWSDAPEAYVVWDTQAACPAAAPTATGPVALEGRFTVQAAGGHISCRPAFEHYRAACAPYTPQRVSELTSLEPGLVERVAEAYAQARSVCYYGWTGVGQHTNATQTDRAIATLHALTGSFDAPGGNVLFSRHPARDINPISLLSASQLAKALGAQARPLGPPQKGWVTAHDLYRAILDGDPYRVRALVGFGSNLVMSHPDPAAARAALQQLEFQVHCDPFLNPTAMFADIVLPAGTAWERESLRVGFEITQEAEELIQLRRRMIPPLGDSRSDMDVVFDLACRLGHGDAFFHGDVEAAWNHVLEPIGVTVAELRERPEGIRLPLRQVPRKYEADGFATETGRVELYSELLLRHGAPPVPGFTAPKEAPSHPFPLILTTGNRGNFCHSQHRDIISLRRRAPEAEARLHPDAARSRGIGAGDRVRVRSRIGAAQFIARIDEAVHPEVVVADYGWWQACPDLGLPGGRNGDPFAFNYNNLIAGDVGDPVSGALGLRSFACEIEPVATGGWHGERPLRVRRKAREVDGVVALTLVAEDGSSLAGFRPGQHLVVRAAGEARSYSLIGPASEAPDRYELAIKRVADGTVSRAIADEVEAGDRLLCRAPGGLFVLPLANDFPVVLFAAGIGITPFLSYLRTLKGVSGEPRVELHYVNRDASRQAFADELDGIAGRLPNVVVKHHLTRPRAGDRFDFHGRLTSACIGDALIAARARFYMCGPDEMMRTLTHDLLLRGVPRFEIFEEKFHAARVGAAPGDGRHEIRFARSGRSLVWTPAKGSILACAEEAGLDIPNGCRVGQCESCAVSVLAGSVVHLAEIAGMEDGVCFTCQAVPASDITLDA